ncbi:uncharacterized protein TNCV_2717971 [Trichonephila clavipes]|nr:uncharacterized protein TNCV_2717971 [Trichonephila clavipes]
MSSRVASRVPRIGSLILGMRSKSQGELLPWRTAILMLARCSTRVTSTSHDTHQLTDFTTLAALLPTITDSSVVLSTHYACRASTRHIYVCDPFTRKKIVAMTYAPTLV